MCSCATAPSGPAAPARSTAPPAISWERWSAETFARAKRERRIVVVTIATEWCHWCHVMDEETWADPAVRALVADRFVAIREDADARPDLAERYADWGWPALAVLSPDAEPVVELRGFQEKNAFTALLRSLTAKLDRGERLARIAPAAPPATHTPLDAIHDVVLAQLDKSYDDKQGGWGTIQKYPLYAPVEHALLRSFLTGEEQRRERALLTVDRERSLVDAVDGGMFQYSLEGVWTAPHYEKLAEINGNALGTFALAYAASHDDNVRASGLAIARYVTTTLRDPSGAFYANQDADVGTRGDRPFVVGKDYYGKAADARRAAGAPFVDTHVYAAHNGRLIAGLARFGAAVDDAALIGAAARAAEAIEATHKNADGAFRHAAADGPSAPVHLADQVAMGQAYLELYEATGDGSWRDRARTTARAIAAFHDEKGGGFFEHPPAPGGFDLDARKPIRQNAEAARFLLKLGRLDDDAAMRALAVAALEAFSDEAVVREEGRMIGEYLLALEEAKAEPLHFAVVTSAGGAPADVDALRRAALAVYAPHRLIEVVAPGAKYPDIGKPALYLCGATFCSPPITDAALVATKAKPFLRPRTSG